MEDWGFYLFMILLSSPIWFVPVCYVLSFIIGIITAIRGGDVKIS